MEIANHYYKFYIIDNYFYILKLKFYITPMGNTNHPTFSSSSKSSPLPSTKDSQHRHSHTSQPTSMHSHLAFNGPPGVPKQPFRKIFELNSQRDH
jgi:hypothetical protein